MRWPFSLRGYPCRSTRRPRSSTGTPSRARSGKPCASIRGRPVGCGHDPVVKVWPQKWKASASSAPSVPATTPAPAPAKSNWPTRARKPRREVPRASASEMRPPSGMHPRASPALHRGGEHALELPERVEGALGEPGPIEIQRDGERAAGDVEHLPGPLVAVLVEDTEGDQRIAAGEIDRGLERLADVTPVGGEHRQRRLRVRTWLELPDQVDARALLRALVGDLERRLRAHGKTQGADLAREAEDEDRERGQAEQRDRQADGEPAGGGQARRGQRREGE